MKLSATISVIIKILETDSTMGITVCSTFQTIPKTAHQFGMKDHAKIVTSGMLFVAKSFRGIGLAGELYKKLMDDHQQTIVFGYGGKKQSINSFYF